MVYRTALPAPLHRERLYAEIPQCEWLPGRIKVDDLSPKDGSRRWRHVWGINGAPRAAVGKAQGKQVNPPFQINPRPTGGRVQRL